MDVRQQIVPTDDVAAGVTEWETARHEPPIFAVGATEAVLDFVRQTGLYGMLPGYDHPWKVDRVHRISRTPFLQFLKCPTEVIKDLAVDVRDLALGRHDRDETRNRLNDGAEALFTADIDNSYHKLQVARTVSQKGRAATRVCLIQSSAICPCPSLISWPKELAMRDSKLPMGHILKGSLWEVFEKTLKKDEKLSIAL